MPPEEKPGGGSIYDYIRAEAEKAGVPQPLALAIAEAESSFSPFTLGPQTKGGERAVGLFQLLPSTAKDYNVDPYEPTQNVRGGVLHIKKLLDRYQGDWDKTIAAYNAGQVAVDQAGGIPNFPETQAYVPKVKANFHKWNDLLPTLPPIATTVAQAETRSPFGRPERIEPDMPTSIRIAREVSPFVGAFAGGTVGGKNRDCDGRTTRAGHWIHWGRHRRRDWRHVGEGGQISLEELARIHGVQGMNPISPDQMLRRFSEAATAGATAEAGGRAAIAIGSKIIRPFAKDIQPWAPEALQVFSDAQGRPTVLPGDLTKSRIVRTGQNIAKGSLAGGDDRSGGSRQTVPGRKTCHGLDGQLGPKARPTQVVRDIQRRLPPTPVAQAEAQHVPVVEQAQAGVKVAKQGVTQARAGVRTAAQGAQAAKRGATTAAEQAVQAKERLTAEQARISAEAASAAERAELEATGIARPLGTVRQVAPSAKRSWKPVPLT